MEDFLEPVVGELLADQVLRGEALKSIRQWTKWVTEADQNCAGGQPILARPFLKSLGDELRAHERALVEASAKGRTKKAKS